MRNRSLWLFLLVAALLFAAPLMTAQSTTATLSGTVVDVSGAVVPDVKITVLNAATSAKRQVSTNSEGYFSIALLPPGKYSLRASRERFSRVEIPNIVLNTNDQRALHIKLKVGTVNESVTVDEATVSIETPGSVSTVVDSNFVKELPLKGRSFQSLLLMTPGVVAAYGNDAGQLSVNGLRTNANYWTIDGVSANVGVSTGNNVNQTFTGAIPGFNSYGATSGLISVDALQEFKVQTSTYSAEFGRQPGGQVQLTTRSGTNQFHGVLYDYFRNEVMEANDWFANRRKDPRPKIRLNDFGGTFGGPMIKDRTFFFFSYEGMRLRQPNFSQDQFVPTIATRNDSRINPTLQALLNSYPVPTGPEFIDEFGTPTGMAQFSSVYSTPQNMNSYSLRLDQVVNSKWTIFGRYNYSPSRNDSLSLNNLTSSETNFKTLTVGATAILSSRLSNQFTANQSTSNGNSFTSMLPLWGAKIPSSDVFFGGQTPPGKTTYAAWSFFAWPYGSTIAYGNQVQNTNRQWNFVDNVTWVRGTHSFKFGMDYRYLYPRLAPKDYNLNTSFGSLDSLYNNTADFLNVSGSDRATIISHNFSLYAQDSWRVNHRLTLDLGLRWDLNPPPHGTNPLDIIVVRGWKNPATMDFAPEGTAPYATNYKAFAPRIGFSYQVGNRSSWETVIRGGYGLFYDLGSSAAANSANGFRSGPYLFGVSFPFDASATTPPPARSFPKPPYDSYVGSFAFVGALDGWVPPRTYQWNLGIQQSLGKDQMLTVNWVANAGRKLARSYSMTGGEDAGTGPAYNNPNFPNWASILITRNDSGYGDSSDYNAMQVQFQRRMSKGLQILSNYTWSHAIDTNSDDTNIFNYIYPTAVPSMSRGNSAFDRRHTFNVAFTYQVPNVKAQNTALNWMSKTFVNGWSVDTIFKVQSGTPFNVTYTRSGFPYDQEAATLRADVVPGVPVWISDPTAPGGKKLNPDAFKIPDTAWLAPQDARNGNLPRNSLFGTGMWQMDASIGREFKMTERMKLQFRAELYNALNHPNFSNVNGDLGFVAQFDLTQPPSLLYGYSPKRFGRSTSMLGSGGQGGTLGMIPLYSTGGPRSVQMALKLVF